MTRSLRLIRALFIVVLMVMEKTDPKEKALDDSIQGVSGIASLNELVLGEPRYLPTVVADKTTAITVVYSILAALFHRERTAKAKR